MFNYFCPKCGAKVDVGADECPNCAAKSELDADETADLTELSRTAGLDAFSSDREVGTLEQPTERNPDPDQSAKDGQNGLRGGPYLGLRLKHYLAFLGLLTVAIVGAFMFSGGFPALRLENPDEATESPVETFAIGVRGPIEVSGIRPYYDDEYQTHVKAFVANHSREAQSVALLVHLRVREASPRAPPLASFEVVISDPVPPNGGQEVDVELKAFGSLQSLPTWDQVRVDLDVL